MKRTIRSFWWLGLGLMVLCCTCPAFAGDVQFQLTTTSGQLWGEYTSPYGTNSPSVGNVICDDFKDTTVMNTNYTYNAVSFNSFTGGVWGSNLTTYQEGAYLAEQVFTSSGSVQQYYNWALWALFDPTDALAKMNANGVTSAGCDAIFGNGAYSNNICHQGTGGFMRDAQVDGPGGNYSNLIVYVPQSSSGGGWCTAAGSCASQEFFGLAPVPEGGTTALYLLIAGLGCLGAVWQSRGTARLEGRV